MFFQFEGSLIVDDVKLLELIVVIIIQIPGPH